MIPESLTAALLVGYTIRLVGAIVVSFVGYKLAVRARKAASRILARPEVDHALPPPVERIFRQVAFAGVMAVTLVAALVILGVPAAAIASITSALLILVTVALRNWLSNMAATLIIVFYQTFRVGEDIETMGKAGTVQEIQVFNTVIMTGDKGLVTLANAEILEAGVKNLSRLGIRRADIEFTVEYGQDLQRVFAVVRQTMAGDMRVLPDPPPYAAVTSLASGGVWVQARSIVATMDYDPFVREMSERLKTELEKAGIRLAEPHQRVYLELPV